MSAELKIDPVVQAAVDKLAKQGKRPTARLLRAVLTKARRKYERARRKVHFRRAQIEQADKTYCDPKTHIWYVTAEERANARGR